MQSAVIHPHGHSHNGHVHHTFNVVSDVAGLRILMVNLYFVGDPSAVESNWVLIDAGLPYSAGRIVQAVQERFGPHAKPRAIILTHGHFDHVGSLTELVKRWHVPVYAHELELPYLTGRSHYPPPDPTVGGGLMARAAVLYPDKPINLGPSVHPLPADGTVPFMPGWQWIATPGHSPGHVSFFRESDQTLIVGDAFVTTKQESLLSIVTQRMEIHGPPMYYTPNFDQAWESVRKLARLHPRRAATGHGPVMSNPRLMHDLNRLARDFDKIAIPSHGRYVKHPARVGRNGVIALPPPASDPVSKVAMVVGIAAVAFTLYSLLRKGNRA